MTPRDVSLRYSNGLVLEVVFRNGYKNNGMWAIWLGIIPGVRLVRKVGGAYGARKRTVEE